MAFFVPAYPCAPAASPRTMPAAPTGHTPTHSPQAVQAARFSTIWLMPPKAG